MLSDQQSPQTTSTIGPRPAPQQPLPDFHVPGAYTTLFFAFVGGVVAPKFFTWAGNREQAKQIRAAREMDIRQQSESHEQQLLRTLIENQSTVTNQLIESNREMAQELRGLSQAINESNKIHNDEIADIQSRLDRIEQSTGPQQILAN